LNPNDINSLQAWFSSVDTDKSGEISSVELAQLNFRGKPLGQDQARKLLAVFDKDRSGQISFQEYAALQQFLNVMSAEFTNGEKRGNTPQSISPVEAHRALQTAGFQVSPTAIQNAAKRFDTTKRGNLSWDDFLALAAHAAMLRSVFEWSDTDHDGKITLDFEQFLYSTLYI